MPEKNRRDPFEEHIESDLFDISLLGEAVECDELEHRLRVFLDELPQPYAHRLRGEALTDQQRRLCDCLTAEVIERVIRPQLRGRLSKLTDDELAALVQVPVAMALLAQKRFDRPPHWDKAVDHQSYAVWQPAEFDLKIAPVRHPTTLRQRLAQFSAWLAEKIRRFRQNLRW